MTDAMGARRKLRANEIGALWMMGAAIGFVLNGVLVKQLAHEGVPPFQIAFARAVFALLPLLPFLFHGGFGAFRTRYPLTHVARAFFGAGAMICGFYALAHLPLATVTALGFTAPLFAVVLAVILLGERIRWRRWSATLVGFGGVLVMTRPDQLIDGGWEPAMGVALLMALGIAMAIVLVKRFPPGESQAVMLFYFCIASILMTVAPAVMVWQAPSVREWLLLAGVGLVGVAAQAMIIKAYRTGETSFIAPFDYVKLPIAGVFGYLLFAEVPDGGTWAGSAIIVAATLYIAQREARLGQMRPVPPLERG